MLCPKCGSPNAKNATECESCAVVFSDIRATKPSRMRAGHVVYTEDELRCAFNDHGMRCQAKGSISNSTDGSGPWYCSPHYWRIHRPHKGDRSKPNDAWFSIKDKLGMAPAREPGDDDEELAA